MCTRAIARPCLDSAADATERTVSSARSLGLECFFDEVEAILTPEQFGAHHIGRRTEDAQVFGSRQIVFPSLDDGCLLYTSPSPRD